MADMGEQPGQGQLIVHGEAGPRRKKMINLLNRSPSPVILEDYGDLEPSKCTVGGPGIAGGIVGVATQVTVTARDASHVRIREGGHQFVLTIKHSGKGGDVKTYDSVDHGDGHYSFSGVRADLKGMHQLSVEVNGTLVGDSPYLVMFEIDDDAELTTENADGTMPVARKSAATSIKERIVFLQRMNPAMTPEVMTDVFEKFGRVMKCEKMLPARDMWMVQFSRAEDAAEAVSINGNEIMGCQVTVALASTLGGVGTHPIIMQQLQHIQAMHFQEQQSTSWATQLAAQRASIRQAGGEVEELTDTRKRRKALALMARLQAKVEHAKGSSGGGGGGGLGGPEVDASLGGEGGSRSAPAEGDGGAGAQDLRNRTRDTRSKSRDRDRGDRGRDDRAGEDRAERQRAERQRAERSSYDRDRGDREKRSRDVERERRGRDDEYERRDRGGPEMRSRDRDRDRVREQDYGRRDGDWRAGDRNGRERRNDERDLGRDRHNERERRPQVEDRRGDERRVDERSSRRRVERGDDRRGEERRGEDRHGGERDRNREKAHPRSREKDVGGRDGDSRRHRDDRHRESGRSRGRDEDREAKGRAGRDEREAPTASPGRNGTARSKRPDDE